MKLLQKLFAAGDALKKGECLENAATWKSVQLLMNPFLAILAFIPQLVDIQITDAQQNAIAYGVATLAVLLNSYFTKATSAKV